MRVRTCTMDAKIKKVHIWHKKKLLQIAFTFGLFGFLWTSIARVPAATYYKKTNFLNFIQNISIYIIFKSGTLSVSHISMDSHIG